MLFGLHMKMRTVSHCEDCVFQILFIFNKSINGFGINLCQTLSVLYSGLLCYSDSTTKSSHPCVGLQPI